MNEITGSISILGETTDAENRQDKYWVTLESQDWIGGEPENASKVLSGKVGKWKKETSPGTGSTTMCLDAGNTPIVEFRNLDPRTVKIGATGNGYAHGRARTLKWTVQNV